MRWRLFRPTVRHDCPTGVLSIESPLVLSDRTMLINTRIRIGPDGHLIIKDQAVVMQCMVVYWAEEPPITREGNATFEFNHMERWVLSDDE